MTTKKDAINWFELFVSDLARAKTFYETILRTPLQDASMEDCQMAMFPCDYEKGVGGCITHRPEIAAGPGGTMVYLNVEGDLDGVLGRVPSAGGAVLKGRLSIGEHGFIGIIKDIDGNVVGLHSMK